jgi:hypothetical protein
MKAIGKISSNVGTPIQLAVGVYMHQKGSVRHEPISNN